MVQLDLHSMQKLLKRSMINYDLLYVINAFGISSEQMMLFSIKLFMSLSLMLTNGLNTIHLEKWPLATSRNILYVVPIGKCPTTCNPQSMKSSRLDNKVNFLGDKCGVGPNMQAL